MKKKVWFSVEVVVVPKSWNRFLTGVVVAGSIIDMI